MEEKLKSLKAECDRLMLFWLEALQQHCPSREAENKYFKALNKYSKALNKYNKVLKAIEG